MERNATGTDAGAGPGDLFRYAGAAEGYDEMRDPHGQPRAAWQGLVQHFNRLGHEELQRRTEEAQLQIENNGVTFNPYDLAEDATRPWALDPIPLVIPEAEWDPLAAGLEQRAILMDLVLRDLLGPQWLLKEKWLPPDFLYGHPGFHPSYMELADSDQRQLHLYATDLARDAMGQWTVVGDRSRAPFGLGYVLENRLSTTRMLPDIFRESRVRRLSRFFTNLKDSLVRLAPDSKDNPLIVLWTKGPKSRSYFEDAYLARYLGFTLVQGDDLAVRQDRVMLKTLGGLLPVDVIFRRLDDDLCDPVELDSRSVEGVSNLLNVMRKQKVAVANGLGSRLIESPMLQPFLPAISQRLLGEPLRLKMIESWWCGQPEMMKWIRQEWESLVFREAYRMGNQPSWIPATMSRKKKDEFLAKLEQHPERFVAQRPIQRSTTPIWNGQQVESWPLAFRSFAVAHEQGYSLLDGGLARVAPDGSVLGDSPTSGEKSQDVWITSQQSQAWKSLLPSKQSAIRLKRGGSELPSRVADSLFWLGRNSERAEFSLRMMRLTLELVENDRSDRLEQSNLLRALAEMGQIPPDLIVPGIKETLPRVEENLPRYLLSDEMPLGYRASLNQVQRLGASVRDRISLDAWRVLNLLEQLAIRETRWGHHSLQRTLAVVDQMMTQWLAFAGLAAESSTRTLGWSFLDLGRRMERVWQTARFLRVMLRAPTSPASLDIALEALDSLMTYRSRYLATLHPVAVCDLLVTDQTNPRSIAYQTNQIKDHVNQLPHDEKQVGLNHVQKLANGLQHRLEMSDPVELMKSDEGNQRGKLEELLDQIERQIPRLSDLVSSQFLIHAGLQRHFASGDGAG